MSPCGLGRMAICPTSAWRGGACQECPPETPASPWSVQPPRSAPPTRPRCSPTMTPGCRPLDGRRASAETWKARLPGYPHGSSSICKTGSHVSQPGHVKCGVGAAATELVRGLLSDTPEAWLTGNLPGTLGSAKCVVDLQETSAIPSLGPTTKPSLAQTSSWLLSGFASSWNALELMGPRPDTLKPGIGLCLPRPNRQAGKMLSGLATGVHTT